MKTKNLLCGIVFLVVVFLMSIAVAGEWVKFEGKKITGDKLELTGILSKPAGDGRYPAVVMLCGCGGLKGEDDAKNQEAWAKRLTSWGYVTLSVDSLTPRNFDNVCTNYEVSDMMIASDAYFAKSYLAKLKYVNPNKIGVIGWSHGGLAVMKVIDALYRDESSKSFQVAIAFYPWCSALSMPDTPLLILIGANDKTCPADQCERLQKNRAAKNTKYEIKLKIYPDAHHAFDMEGLNKDVFGFHVEYNPEAAADAIIQTRDFLAKYLKAKM